MTDKEQERIIKVIQRQNEKEDKLKEMLENNDIETSKTNLEHSGERDPDQARRNSVDLNEGLNSAILRASHTRSRDNNDINKRNKLR